MEVFRVIIAKVVHHLSKHTVLEAEVRIIIVKHCPEFHFLVEELCENIQNFKIWNQLLNLFILKLIWNIDLVDDLKHIQSTNSDFVQYRWFTKSFGFASFRHIFQIFYEFYNVEAPAISQNKSQKFVGFVVRIDLGNQDGAVNQIIRLQFRPSF